MDLADRLKLAAMCVILSSPVVAYFGACVAFGLI